MVAEPKFVLDGPIVGILVQEDKKVTTSIANSHTFIPTSYVKFIELGGARVIPIWFGQDEEYYKKVVYHTNGALIGGTSNFFSEYSDYFVAVQLLYKAAKRQYDQNGVYYPIIGIGLGMLLLAAASTEGELRRTAKPPSKLLLPLNLKVGAKNSKLFKDISKDLMHKITTRKVAYYENAYCIFAKDMRKNWNILAVNIENNDEYVSIMVHDRYPIYCFQFSPQTTIYELKDTNISHNINAIQFSQHIANFFVMECRKNQNAFPSLEIKRQLLIYNFRTALTAVQTKFQQLYIFDHRDYRKTNFFGKQLPKIQNNDNCKGDSNLRESQSRQSKIELYPKSVFENRY